MGNSHEIGKVCQVIEKWVFFKLLFANLTDSSGGKNHSPSKNTIYFLQGNLKNQINFIKIKYHNINTEQIDPLFSFCFRQLILVVFLASIIDILLMST